MPRLPHHARRRWAVPARALPFLLLPLTGAQAQDRAAQDRAAQDRAARDPAILDRVVLADRAAAMNGEMYLRTQRTAANAFALPGSVNWWTTIRNNVVGFSMQGAATDVAAVQGIETRPVITYISRQGWNRRKLRQGDHERLVEELERLSLPFTDDSVPSEAELRIAQAQLVGWLEGLFHGIQTALFAQQMAARAQLEQMRRALPPGMAHEDEEGSGGDPHGPIRSGPYL